MKRKLVMAMIMTLGGICSMPASAQASLMVVSKDDHVEGGISKDSMDVLDGMDPVLLAENTFKPYEDAKYSLTYTVDEMNCIPCQGHF